MTAAVPAPVLLVDDRPENLTALEALLGDLGLDVVMAQSGNEALRLSLKTEFALVLLDVQMPVMDGFETATLLRANPKTRRMPIIFVTAGMKDSAYRFKGYETGAVDYLMKPIEPRELRSKVRVFCDLFLQRKELERHEQVLETLVEQRTIALRESEASYRGILENTADYVMRYDRRGVHLFANASTLAFTGLSLDQFVGKTHRELGFPEELCTRWEAAIEKVFVSGEATSVSFEIQSPDGPVFLELKLSPEKDILGQVRSVVGVSRDFTERHRLEAVSHFLAQASWTVSEDSFFQTLARYLAACLNMDYVCIDRLEGDAKAAQTLANFCDGKFDPNISYTLQDTPCGDVVKKRVCCFPQGVRHQFPKDAMLQEMVAESYVGTTLWSSRGEVIGLIAVIGRRPLINPGLAEKILELVAIRTAGELERQLAEDALHASENRYSAALNAIEDGLWDWHVSTGDAFFSASYYAMLGYDDVEFPACYEEWRKLVHPDDLERVEQGLRLSLASLQGFSLDLRMKMKSGEWRWVSTRGKTIETDASGKTLRMVGTLTNLTAWKQAEEERRQLQERVSQAQKLEALGVLVAGVAHNFNNVLAAIMAGASAREILARDTKDQETYALINKACKRGRDVVKSLIQFAKPTLSTQMPLELHALITELRVLLENTTQDRIQILEAFAGEPVWVNGDGGSLSHALMNLCLNALDAMPNGGDLILRTFLPQPGWVEVSIEDNGEGMSPDILAHVTEPFFTTKEVGKGTGLGLSMTHGVVKAHGGTLGIVSVPGQGTTVKLRLPRIPAPGSTPSPERPLSSQGSLNVLLVDDDEDVRFLMARMLKNAGHRVQSLASGEGALRSLGAGPLPDLIILDQNMPGMSGVQTLEKIRALRSDVPILISSGQPDIEEWACFKQPKVGVISKPFEMEELLVKMAQFAPNTLSSADRQ